MENIRGQIIETPIPINIEYYDNVMPNYYKNNDVTPNTDNRGIGANYENPRIMPLRTQIQN